MKRQLPPEIDKVKGWCLAKEKFDEANFIMNLKSIMESNQKISARDAGRLRSILNQYVLDIDLMEKIRSWKR